MKVKIAGPSETFESIKKRIKPIWIAAFLSVVILGILIHLPMMLRDIPNHDGLDSMYFDQNMITSGRWFLTVACGLSTYFTLPWVISVFSLVFLGVANVLLVDFLEVQKKGTAVLIGGLLVSFPALASTFAYVFTMDGYMLALALAIAAPWLTRKYKWGFIPGSICLALSLGTYQAYLPFAILLCLYGIVLLLLSIKHTKDKVWGAVRYLAMGVLGMAVYYGMLRLLLLIQGKELDTYQGINGMAGISGNGIGATLKAIYADFLSFSLKSGVVAKNIFSLAAVAIIILSLLTVLIRLIAKKKLYKSIWLYITVIVLLVAVPVAVNVILIISPTVNYHLLMRYQWVLLLICSIAFTEKFGDINLTRWGILISCSVMVLNYALIDNIAYSNLQKKYERTYSYCLRLADRMEQTEGYYQGIPVAMVGVISSEEYPSTDITGDVTGSMIGMTGDYLLYTEHNYVAFMKHYLGVTINEVPISDMEWIYYSEEYQALNTFPAADSMKVVDGILYIKLE